MAESTIGFAMQNQSQICANGAVWYHQSMLPISPGSITRTKLIGNFYAGAATWKAMAGMNS